MSYQKQNSKDKSRVDSLLDFSNFSLPHAEESEIQVLGSIIRKGELINKVNLSPNDFSLDRHKGIFSLMRDMQRQGVKIDVLSIFQEAKKTGKEGIVGGSGYLTYLVEVTHSTANFE